MSINKNAALPGSVFYVCSRFIDWLATGQRINGRITLLSIYSSKYQYP
ncbi:hypothetical protein [Undibacterium griseum]|nr:hypothetical protein [Undibacterium griseum]